MDEERMTERTARALRLAQAAWEHAHRGLSASLVSRTAAIPATGVLAAALLSRLDEDDPTITARAEQAILIARRAWERTHLETSGNPIAMTAEKSVIGILAAGILSHQDR